MQLNDDYYNESENVMLIFSSALHGKNGSLSAYKLLETTFLVRFDESMPDIKKTPNGKPYFPERPEVHFSLSHGTTHVLCALSDTPVGCDIERISRKISKRAQEYFCTPAECEMFDPLDLWVLKESYVKLFGLTFASLKHLRFHKDGTDIILPNPLVSARLYTIDGCRAGICSLGELPPDTIKLI